MRWNWRIHTPPFSALLALGLLWKIQDARTTPKRRTVCFPSVGQVGGQFDCYELHFTNTAAAYQLTQQGFPSFDYVDTHRSASDFANDPDNADEWIRGPRGMLWNVGRSPYIALIRADRIQTTDLNPWNFNHAAGLVEYIQGGDALLEPPAARVYRVEESDVPETQQWADAGELEYETGMSEPWEPEDVGELYADLVDGNHRAIAAIVAGAEWIPVYVGPNFQNNVTPEEYAEVEALKGV